MTLAGLEPAIFGSEATPYPLGHRARIFRPPLPHTTAPHPRRAPPRVASWTPPKFNVDVGARCPRQTGMGVIAHGLDAPPPAPQH